MAVALRLMRFGKRKQPYYRIVALDKTKKRDGSYIEKVGLYHPLDDKNNIRINKERFDYWKSKGALISEGLERLLKNKENVVFE
ncbi:30S ribosomal protein S16 [Candidatus Roizmanbacteria bacterium]|nr:MAG: 30S ribosomal protein S16 [Candidatus Roizmanbacteria bacterium]